LLAKTGRYVMIKVTVSHSVMETVDESRETIYGRMDR